MQLFFEDNSFNRGSRQQDIASRYCNKTDFQITTTDLDTILEGKIQFREWLFTSRNQSIASIKQKRSAQFIPAAVPYMTAQELQYWQTVHSELFTEALFQYNYLLILNRKQAVKFAYDELQSLQRKLQYLEMTAQNDKQAMASPLYLSGDADWTPIAYLGFNMSEWCTTQYKEAKQAPTTSLIGWLNDINWHRLYWVWAGGNGGLVASTLELDFFRQLPSKPEASAKLEAPSLFFNYSSWILYFFRCGVNLALMAKHTLLKPLMSAEEKKISADVRLAAQWQQRKYSILNDIVWGWVNCSSMLWFTDAVSPAMGVIGGWLNIILMYFDVYMAQLELTETRQRYLNARLALQNNKTKIEKEMAELFKLLKIQSIEQLYLLSSKHAMSAQIQKLKNLDASLFSVNQDVAALDFDWCYKQAELKSVLKLAKVFVLAMVLMFAPIFSVMFPALAISVSMQANLVFIGCVMSVLLTAYDSYTQFQIAKQKETSAISGLMFKAYQNQHAHQQLVTQHSHTPAQLNQLRMHHFEHKRLEAEYDYHKAMFNHLNFKQYHSAIVQLTFPLIVLGSIFLSAPVTVGIISSSLFISMVSYLYGNALQPKQVDNDKLTFSKETIESPTNALSSIWEADTDKPVDKRTPNFSLKALPKLSLFATSEACSMENNTIKQPDF